MKSNKILSIAGLAVIFAIFFAAGLFIPIEGRSEKAAKEAEIAAAEAAAARHRDSLAAVAEAASKVSGIPEIEPCKAAPLGKRFGYQLYVKASVESGDPLSYALCEEGSTVARYSSANGYFGSKQNPVLPSESGSYNLIVTNTRTGETATMTVSGFNKLARLTEAQLQQRLNADVYSDDFYVYLVEAQNQKIEFENPEGKGHLNNVDVLGNAKNANGWSFEVIPGSIQYDKYNRVKGFKVKVIE